MDYKLYKSLIGRYNNPLNKIKNYSVKIALDIYEDIRQDPDEVLICTNSVINPEQLKAFSSRANRLWLSSLSQRIAQDFYLPLSGIEHKQFDFIFSDLNLNFSQNIIETLNSYERALKKNGIFMANILGGKTLYELTNSMMQSDLIENRMITRMLPKLTGEGLLNLSKNSNFKNPIVMSNELVLDYGSVRELIQSLREIAHVYPMERKNPPHPYTKKSYWDGVESDYKKVYSNKATFEFITVFIIK